MFPYLIKDTLHLKSAMHHINMSRRNIAAVNQKPLKLGSESKVRFPLCVNQLELLN